MPKMLLQNSLSVVVDTNVLFAKDLAKIAGSNFETAWKECSQLANISVFVPEVVKGERLYQLVTMAGQSIELVVKHFETVSRITALPTPKLPNQFELRAAVEGRFETWLREHNAVVVETPCDKMNWKQLVQAAIWRVTPFVPAGEGKDSEKGFRDCLILETVREYLTANPTKDVAFVSGDKVLREAAVALLDPKLFNAYVDMAALSSYLKLTHEQLTRNHAQEMMKKAPAVFFTADDPECVYIKFSIYKFITSRFGIPLLLLPDTQPSIFVASRGFGSPVGEEKIFIDSTEFVAVTAGNIYEWKTRIRFVRLFKIVKSGIPSLANLDWMDERIRTAKFDVVWRASIDVDGTFSNLTLGPVTKYSVAAEVAFLAKGKYGL